MEAERGEREVGRTEFIVRLYRLYKVWDKGSSLLYWCQDIAGRFCGARHRRLLIMESKILESIIVMSLTPSSVVLLSLAEARYLIESSAATNLSSVCVTWTGCNLYLPKIKYAA
jgi:hypothetical protein